MNVIEAYSVTKIIDINGIYCIYLRKSRADVELEKKGKIDTLKRHRVILLNLARSFGLDPNKIVIYEEVVSGETIKAREEMQKLLLAVEKNTYTGVFVVEVSRLSRGDKIDQGEIVKYFKYTNTLVITPDKVYDLTDEKDEELFEDELTSSSKELKATKKRLSRGRNSSVLEGKYVASIPPYGYQRKKIEDDKGFTLVENQQEAIIVKEIFNLYAYDNSPRNNIPRELNKRNLKPRIADKWSASTIKDILRNPAYIGKIRWNHRKSVKILKNGEIVITRPRNSEPLIVDGLHEPIIDLETWNIVQERLKRNRAPVQHNNIVKNPLLHILICDKCGSYMQRRPYVKQNKETSIVCNCKECNNISSKFKYVEEEIIEGLKHWLKSYQTDYSKVNLLKNSKNVKFYEDAISQTQNQIDNANKELEKVCEAYEKGIYTDEVYRNRYHKHKENISILEHNIIEYRGQLDKEYAILKEKDIMLPKLQNVIDIYYKLETPEEKNNLLKTVVEKVTYLKETPTLKKTDDPKNFTIRIYPKLPK